MPIIRLTDVSLAYGHVPLLDRIDMQVDPGERVCLVGRNGTGKTTLFRVITGVAAPDQGEIWRMETLRVAHLEQEVPPDTDQTIFDVVASGSGWTGAPVRPETSPGPATCAAATPPSSAATSTRSAR